MPRFHYPLLPLALGLLAGTACSFNATGADICLHSEGCGGGGGGWKFTPPLAFNGLVTSASTGQPLAGVTVRFEAPARASIETVLTDANGRYGTLGLADPKSGDCVGLAVTFSRPGYQALRITDFPTLNCAPGSNQLNASLTPEP